MDPATTETRFAFETFLPVWMIVVAGLLLLGVSWWNARRETRMAGASSWIWVLFGLRVVAVLVLLWMLLGPTLVTVLRQFKTKTVAVLVDRSASMGLVDVADGSGNVSRWAAARQSGADTQSIRELDAAAATVRAAQNRLERFAKLPDATPNNAEIKAMFAHAVRAIETAAPAIASAAKDLPGGAGDLQRGLTETAKNLNDPRLAVLREKRGQLERGKSLASLERTGWLPDALTLVAIAAGQLERFSDQFARSLEESAGTTLDAAAASEAKLSRYDKIESFMADAEKSWLKELRGKAAVTHYEFGAKIVPFGEVPWTAPESSSGRSQPLDPSTQLGLALQQVALDRTTQPVDVAILITDGGHNQGRDPRELAPSLAGAALHIVPAGNTKIQRDVVLHHTHAPKAALLKDTVAIDAVVTAYDCNREKIEVELLDNDVVVDHLTLDVAGEIFDSRVQLRWKADQLGKHTLSFRAVPVADERTADNNASQVDVRVVEDKIHVLVADQFPRWETRYLLNLFKRDSSVTFDQLLFEPQVSEGSGARSTFPVSVEEWAKYRVVILGDVLPAQLPPERQKILRDYVADYGGNLILVAGPQAMPGAYLDQPLGGILPVVEAERALANDHPYYLYLGEEGSTALATQIAENNSASELVWREMSQRMPLYSLSAFSKPKPTAHSLIWASQDKTSYQPGDGRTRSFLSWHYVGAGRVVYLSAPVTYQLRYRQGDRYHHRFWGQLLRWAVARDLAEGSQTVRLSTDKPRYEEGEQAQVSVRLRQLDGKAVSGALLSVAASQGSQVIREIQLKEDAVQPGTYHGLLDSLPVGQAKLQVTGDRIQALLESESYRKPVETTVDIDPSGVLELRHPLCNLSLLRELADASGGLVVPPTGLKAALDQINLEPQAIETTTKKPLWNRWDLFWLFMACLTLEWVGRKRMGLS